VLSAWIVNLIPLLVGGLLLWHYVFRKPDRVRAIKRALALVSRRPVRYRLRVITALFSLLLVGLAILDWFMFGHVRWGLDLAVAGAQLALWGAVLFLVGPRWGRRRWPRR
jgi:hypothetical protein